MAEVGTSFKVSKLLVFYAGVMRGSKVISFANSFAVEVSILSAHSFLISILTWVKTSIGRDLLWSHASNLQLISETIATRIIVNP